jgi:ketosteroid isomerase-like protein
MANNLELIKKGYEDFARGDVQAATELWADDFVWDGPGSEDLPGGGRHTGKPVAMRVLEGAVGVWDEFSLSVDELHEDGDTVIALGHNDVTKDGNSDRLPWVQIWRLNDEGRVQRLQLLTDTLRVARLLGVV